MTGDLSRTDRLWLGAHGDERYAGEWAELQREEMLAAMDPYERTIYDFDRQLRALAALPDARA